MAIIFSEIIKRGGKEYKIEFGFDDAAVADTSAKALFNLKASYRPVSAGKQKEEWKEIPLEAELDLVKRVITFSYNGKPIGEVPLEIPVPDYDPSGGPLDIGAEDKVLDEHLKNVGNGIDAAVGEHFKDAAGGMAHDHAVEAGIHLIPTDPFLGCIIKGAASTAIGQIIRCWRANRDIPVSKQLAKRIISCLKDHWQRMLLTFIWRAGRCAVLVGLG